MQDIKIKSSTTISPFGRERFYEGSGKNAVLLIHGFTGHPEEMDYLGRSINRETGMTVYIPRLPGHGTNTADFRESRARDWLRKTYDSYLRLKQDYLEVIPAGLSMGGLLAILTAARFKTKKLVLIAAALYARNNLLPFSHILKYFRPEIPIKDQVSVDFSSEAERFHYENYGINYYTAQIAELHKLMVLARRKLPEVIAQTLILASRKDGAVPLKAAEELQEKIPGEKKVHIFADSPHVINNGPAKEQCARLIIDFLKL